MDMTYGFITEEDELLDVYRRFRKDGSMWAFYHMVDEDDWSDERWLSMWRSPDVAMLGGYIDGELCGVMAMKPAMEPDTMCLAIGVAAFRPHYGQAEALCRGAFLWVLDNVSPCPASFMGWIPAPNRHSLRMMGSLGFSEQGRVPGLLWYTRLQRFVDGVLVTATPESIRATVKE